ncbi:hypothetical protein EJB05_33727, partial [Eragrostis curvula]
MEKGPRMTKEYISQYRTCVLGFDKRIRGVSYRLLVGPTSYAEHRRHMEVEGPSSRPRRPLEVRDTSSPITRKRTRSEHRSKEEPNSSGNERHRDQEEMADINGEDREEEQQSESEHESSSNEESEDSDKDAAEDHLFVLDVTRAPFGRVVTVFCVHPHPAATAELKLSYSRLNISSRHHQCSEFKLECTDLSSALPADSKERFHLVLPRTVHGQDEGTIQIEALIGAISPSSARSSISTLDTRSSGIN